MGQDFRQLSMRHPINGPCFLSSPHGHHHKLGIAFLPLGIMLDSLDNLFCLLLMHYKRIPRLSSRRWSARGPLRLLRLLRLLMDAYILRATLENEGTIRRIDINVRLARI